ncbi:MAG: hypothetical protein MZV63_65880 [Marinilabiliales bacterium]|nr:hypothetical protein [Marinilabiliales bacterium]
MYNGGHAPGPRSSTSSARWPFTTVVFLAPLRFIELGLRRRGDRPRRRPARRGAHRLRLPDRLAERPGVHEEGHPRRPAGDGRPDRRGRVHPERRADGGGVPAPRGSPTTPSTCPSTASTTSTSREATRTASTADSSAGSPWGRRRASSWAA